MARKKGICEVCGVTTCKVQNTRCKRHAIKPSSIPARKCVTCDEWFCNYRRQQVHCSRLCYEKNAHTIVNAGQFKKGVAYSVGTQFRKGLSPWNKGARHLCGEKHWNWQGGKTDELKTLRNSHEYRVWRKSVFQRDGFKCVECGSKKGPFNADHIKPFAYFPELRFSVENGRTLCEPCHRLTPTYLYKARILYENCIV